MTADDIAARYPYRSPEDQAHILEIENTAAALMSLADDKNAYPRDDLRQMLGQQVGQVRESLISMLGQK